MQILLSSAAGMYSQCAQAMPIGCEEGCTSIEADVEVGVHYKVVLGKPASRRSKGTPVGRGAVRPCLTKLVHTQYQSPLDRCCAYNATSNAIYTSCISHVQRYIEPTICNIPLMTQAPALMRQALMTATWCRCACRNSEKMQMNSGTLMDMSQAIHHFTNLASVVMSSTTMSSWLGFMNDQPQKPQRDGQMHTGNTPQAPATTMHSPVTTATAAVSTSKTLQSKRSMLSAQ